MQVFGLLCVTRIYAKPKCMVMKYAKCVWGKHACLCKPKCMSAVCANQNAQVKVMQTKRSTEMEKNF